ncbi:hypothetical protein [Chondrinema litorale]|uniref:hypothetical protein n=1 Tax=Chondrinema litorale TaxID=2994555 RepID=UPI002543A2FE|nr:hypothetical protein [Chondrinema litorale]UZR99397.1 hypothetical protein OQ292_36040 [Chondrinema litorale]
MLNFRYPFLSNPSMCFFIRKENALNFTDEQLLKLLLIEEYNSINALDEYKLKYERFFIVESKNWIHIIDDNYGLDFTRNIKEILIDLGKTNEVFYCWIDDCGPYQFEWIYYKDGMLKRKYVVNTSDEIIEDYGIPLNGEKDALSLKDNLEKTCGIISSIGIDFNLLNIRGYEFFNPNDFIFNEEEY